MPSKYSPWLEMQSFSRCIHFLKASRYADLGTVQSSQRSTLPPERPMNGERPERNRDRTGTGTTGTERPSVPFLAFLAFPVVPVHSSEKMERCLLKLSCYQTKRNLTFKTIQSDHSSAPIHILKQCFLKMTI